MLVILEHTDRALKRYGGDAYVQLREWVRLWRLTLVLNVLMMLKRHQKAASYIRALPMNIITFSTSQEGNIRSF